MQGSKVAVIRKNHDTIVDLCWFIMILRLKRQDSHNWGYKLACFWIYDGEGWAKMWSENGRKSYARRILCGKRQGKNQTTASSASEYVQEATVVYHQIRIFPQQELPQIS